MFVSPGHSAAVMPSPPTLVFTAPMLSDAPASGTSGGGSGVRLLRQCPADGRFNVLVISGLSWHVSEPALREYLCALHPHAQPTTVRLYTHPQNGVSRGRCFVEYAGLSTGAGYPSSHHGAGHGGASGGGVSGGVRGSGSGAVHTSAAATSSARGAVPLFMSGVSANPAWSPSPLPPGADAVPVLSRLEDVKNLIESTPFDGATLEVCLYYLTATRWDREGKLPDLPTTVPLPARRLMTGYGSEGFVVRCGPQLGLANTVTPEGAAQVRRLRKRWRAKQRSMDAGQRL